MPPDDPMGYGLGDGGESTESQAAESPEPPETDPEAPYGYTVKGTPRKSRAGRKPGGASAGPRPPKPGPHARAKARAAAGGSSGPQGAPRPPGAARKPSGGPRSSTRRNTPADYAAGIEGLLNMAGGALWGAGAMFGRVDLQLDAAAILYHGPGAAIGLGQIAASDPRLAAIADKLLTAGPYAEATMYLLALAAQVGVNHRAVPAGLGVMLGALPPEELLNRVAVNFGATPPPPAAAPEPPAAAA